MTELIFIFLLSREMHRSAFCLSQPFHVHLWRSGQHWGRSCLLGPDAPSDLLTCTYPRNWALTVFNLRKTWNIMKIICKYSKDLFYVFTCQSFLPSMSNAWVGRRLSAGLHILLWVMEGNYLQKQIHSLNINLFKGNLFILEYKEVSNCSVVLERFLDSKQSEKYC